MNNKNQTPRALVTGIGGQDGAYLSKLLLDKGYEVYGGLRRSATQNMWRLEELGIADRIEIVEFDLLEFSNILDVIKTLRPTEVYNLAAQSFVSTSFKQPIFTSDANALGVTRILEALHTVNPETRFYQASTSEMFGNAAEAPQTEQTPMAPRSPYGVAKLYGHRITINYREAYGMYAVSGILFNHESDLRSVEFVTRKVTSEFAKIRHGQADCLSLGNLNPARDWGHAADYVRGIWLMLQQDKADDYLLASGETHTIREFVEIAANAADFDLEWSGEGLSEAGVDRKTGKTIVKVDPKLFRPAEIDTLIGDASKAREKLNWNSEYNFEQLVTDMFRADMDRLARGGRIF